MTSETQQNDVEDGEQVLQTDVEGLFAEHKEELLGEWHETFDALTAQGKSPSGIKATIEYVTTSKTQQEVSQEYGVSDMTIRTLQSAVVALGPIEAKRASQHGSGQMTSLDYCTHVADRLEWEEGVEYAINTKSGYSGTQMPSLRKEGWRDLYQLTQPRGDEDE